MDYACEVLKQLQAAGIAAEIDQSNERMGAKIRSAQLAKIPYMLILGDREQAGGAVSVRLRTEEDRGVLPVSAVIMQMKEAVQDKRYI